MSTDTADGGTPFTPFTSPRTIDRASGRVSANGVQIGKIERPYEEGGRQVRRSTYKVIMCGRAAGTAPGLTGAQAIVQGWEPSDETDRAILARAEAGGLA